MQKTNFHTNHNFIFTRWSRKSYALFTVLGKVVHIGHLVIDMLKTVEAQLLGFMFTVFNSSENNTLFNEDDVDQLPEQELTFALPTLQSDCYPAEGFLSNIYIFQAVYSRVNGLYFYTKKCNYDYKHH